MHSLVVNDETNLLILIISWLDNSCQIKPKRATVTFSRTFRELNTPYITIMELLAGFSTAFNNLIIISSFKNILFTNIKSNKNNFTTYFGGATTYLSYNISNEICAKLLSLRLKLHKFSKI